MTWNPKTKHVNVNGHNNHFLEFFTAVNIHCIQCTKVEPAVFSNEKYAQHKTGN